MPPPRRLHRLTPSEGFHAALAALGLSPGLMARGSQNFVPTADGRMRAWLGLLLQAAVEGGTVMMPASDGYASLGTVGSPGSGNAVASISNSLWYAGSGRLRFNGAFVGALSASSTLSFILRSGGSYATTAYQAGRVAPSPPALTARDNVGGKMNGGVSLRTTRINSITGGESDASELSPAVTITDGKLLVSFDGISLDSNGQDKWGLYACRVGFQTKGPHYGIAKTPEVTDASLATLFGVLRATELEFTDADLDYERIAPIDNDPPPACTHVAAIENFIVGFGVFGGTGVIASKQNYLEAFPLENLQFLPERPVAVYPRPSDGFILVACPGSLHAVVPTGATPPYALQTIFPEVGVAAHHNLCFTENMIYMFTEKRGICRGSRAGEPDYEFAARVAEYTSGWTPANVVVGYDVPTQHVVYAHGSEMLAFNKQTGAWSAPLKLSALRSGGAAAPVSGTVRSAVTYQRKLYFGIEAGGVYALYRYTEGGGGSRAIYQSPWMAAADEADTVSRAKLALEGAMNRAATVEFFTNGDESTVKETFNITAQAGGSRLRHLKTLKPNLRNAESVMMRLTLDSDDGSEGLIEAVLRGAGSGVPL